MRPAPPPRSRSLRTAGWVLVGAGGASLVAGVVLGAMTSSRADDLEQRGAALDTYYADVQDDERGGRALQTGQIVSLAVGGAAAAAGVVLLLLDRRNAGRESRAWVAPMTARGGGGVLAGLRF